MISSRKEHLFARLTLGMFSTQSSDKLEDEQLVLLWFFILNLQVILSGRIFAPPAYTPETWPDKYMFLICSLLLSFNRSASEVLGFKS